MNREYHTWHSPALSQELELLVFGHAGARVLVFPTRDGRFFDYEDWRMVAALGQKIEAGELQLYCLDSIDRQSLYANWARPEDRMRRHLDYERYVLDEVIPFTQERNEHPTLVAHGCSLGAFHAMNLALRHPQTVNRVVAFSGRYDLTESVGSFRGLFDGHYDETIYFNTPTHFLANLTDEVLLAQLRRLEIVFTIGRDDAFFPNNERLASLLNEKAIAHQFAIWDGEAHRPRYWRPMARLYL
ncbi:alpha/beta hydrolase-fold protein [Armatimonas rosea]|uniref:Esterase/lipase superfamily enzyme n=1 Tax=Armatimonas rosea TaxID=685828 RepID=A0A7W9SSU6_ARMRO|nr:esterase/lipase superfamily enzyme [Armatimonas rosea]